MKKILAAIGVSVCAVSFSQAQTDEDALRYSQTQLPFGTARSMGTGSAFGAVGADFTALTINPASIAFYKANEFTITPGFSASKTETEFAGQTNEARKYNLNMSNMGIVFTWLKDTNAINNRSNWKSFSFGFGANRVATFHRDVYFKGLNTSNSMVSAYLQYINSRNLSPANVEDFDPFGYSLFYAGGLIQPKPGSQDAYTSPLENGGLEQSKSYTTRGGITDYSLTFGGNYNDKLMVGVGLGIPSLRYDYESTFSESDVNDSIPNFNRFDYNYDQTTSGVGINGKLGLIYKVHDAVRVGVSVQTPTYFSMQDTWDASLSANYNSGTVDESPEFDRGRFNYALVTPWKLTGSAAFIIKQHGFISVDYDWQDYSEANFVFNNNATNADKEHEATQNQEINSKYSHSGTVRIGGELALNIFRMRAGYGLGLSPLKSVNEEQRGFDERRQSISTGFGFMEENFFLDFAFRHTSTPSWHQPYLLNNDNDPSTSQYVPGAKLSSKANHLVLTLGLKF